MRPITAFLAGVLLLAAALPPVAHAQCTEEAAVRVIHASPDAGNVDVLINEQKAVADLQFRAATGYTALRAGAVKVQVNQAGKDTAAIGPVDLTLTPLGRFTIVAVGQASTGGQQPVSTLMVRLFQDDATPPAAGQAKARVIHLSPDAGPVDILAGDQKVIEKLEFPNASPYLEVPAGTYSVRVNKAGTNDTVIGPLELNLVAGRNYTVYASGLASAQTLAANLVIDRAFDAQVRLVHASPNAPGVDVLVDGRPAVSNLTFPSATPYVAFPALGACVVVAPTGTTTPVLAPVSLGVESGSKTTVMAVGLVDGTPPLGLAVFSDLTEPPAADRAKIRLIHASPDAPGVDVLAGDQVLVSNLTFPTASPFIEVPAGTLAVRVNQTGTQTTVLGPIDLTVSSGDILTIVARGLVNDKSLGLTILTDVSGG